VIRANTFFMAIPLCANNQITVDHM
jgi:hypothetical protein